MMSRPVIVYAKATGAVLVTLALVVGVPVGLVTLVGWPLPRSLSSPSEVSDAFAREGVPTEFLVKALAVIVWLAWVQIMWAFMVEAVAVARGRAAQRAAVLPGVQVLASQLIAGIALVASAVGPARPVGAVALAAPPVDHIAALLVEGHTPPAPTSSTAPDRLSSVPQTAAPADREGEHTMYETKRGDTFWRLAQDHLGSGTRWREIRDLNAGRAVAAGCVLAPDQDRLQPGWRILLPVSPGRGVPAGTTAQAASGPPAAESAAAPSGPDAPLLPAGGMVRYDEDALPVDDEAEDVDGVDAVTIAFTGDGPPPSGAGMIRYEEDDLRDEEEDPSSGVGQRFLGSDGPPWRPRPAHLARRRRR